MSDSSEHIPVQILKHFSLALDRTQTQIEEVQREIQEKTDIFNEVQQHISTMSAVFQDIETVVEDSKSEFKDSDRKAQDVMVAVLRLRECWNNFAGSIEAGSVQAGSVEVFPEEVNIQSRSVIIEEESVDGEC